MKITPDFSLINNNTFALDVKSVYFIEVESIDDAVILSKDEYFRSLPFLMLGAGSKILFVGDFKGAIVHFSGDDVRILEEDAHSRTIAVGAAKKWEDLVLETAGEGLWGLENLALIPGQVGGSAVQNAGAYGAELKDTVVGVTYVDLADGTIHRLSNPQSNFGYRNSIFKQPGMETALICEVDFKLSKDPKPNLNYKGLQDLQGRDDLTPMDVANAVIAVRQSKLPYPSDIPNAGSFFLNPVIPHEQYEQLAAQYPDIPHFDTVDLLGNPGVKVPAAWLIEQSGMKGYKLGNVGTYEKQPLVIVSNGSATSREIVELSELIQAKVKDKFGIELHPEVHFIRSAECRSVNDYAEDEQQ